MLAPHPHASCGGVKPLAYGILKISFLPFYVRKRQNNYPLLPTGQQHLHHDSNTMRFEVIALMAFAALASATLAPNYTSKAGVEIYNPSSFFNTTGPWSLMSRAGDYLYISGTQCPASE